MARWKVNVIETRNYYVDYVVEAETLEEAAQRIEAGETIEEHEVQFSGVTDRYFEDGDITLVKEGAQ